MSELETIGLHFNIQKFGDVIALGDVVLRVRAKKEVSQVMGLSSDGIPE